MENELSNLRLKINQLESKLNNHSMMTQDYINGSRLKSSNDHYNTYSGEKSQYYESHCRSPDNQKNTAFKANNTTLVNNRKNKDIYEYRPLQMKSSMKSDCNITKKSILKNKNGSLRIRANELKDSGRGLSSER